MTNTLVEKLKTDGSLVGLETRPARALIGWMPERDAQVMLAIPEAVLRPLPAHVQRVREAHAAARSRPTGVDQTHLFSDIGEEVQDYLAILREHSSYKPHFASGRTIRVADLNKVCALQCAVHLDFLDRSDHFGGLFQQAVQTDMRSLMKITLPLPTPSDLPVQVDQQNGAWVLRCRDLNPRVVGPFNARIELAPGLFGIGYGFCVAVLPDFVQVVRYRGRYFLQNGYHRALALLEKGITHIPVMVQELSESQSLEIDGRLPDETILGARPPLFRDYLRDDVAAVVANPVPRKTIMIQAAEDLAWV